MPVPRPPVERFDGYHEVKLLLTSEEYIRWQVVAVKKRSTAAGMLRWLALEYLGRAEARLLETGAPAQTD